MNTSFLLDFNKYAYNKLKANIWV